jgi:hypothetical protein
MTPAALWYAANARRDDAATARAIGFDRAKLPDAWYALLPFVIVDTDDGPLVAATTEPELPLTEQAVFPVLDAMLRLAELDIDDAHDATTGPSDDAAIFCLDARGRIGFLGERTRNTLYVPPQRGDETVQLFTDGATFFRAWVAARVRWMQQRRAVRRDSLAELPERTDGCVPGALLIGDARAVHWPPERVFVCSDAPTARAVEVGIRRSARMSEVILAPLPARKAA